VTAGFEATIPLSRGRGYGEGLDELAKNDMSSGTRPDPLVPQTLIRSVRERVDYSGAVLMDLAPEDVRQALRALVDAGAEALVVCLTKTRLDSVRDVVELMRLFSGDYGRRFGEGSQSPEAGIRVTAVRVASFVPGETIEFDATLPDGRTTAARPTGSRRCFFPRSDGPAETAVYDESALEPGLAVPGPAVVTTPTTTYLVEPGWRIETGTHGDIWFLADSH
jgi:N-methylhydantoinase A/oxoprolinase/acetone carboxylase beta subunit